MESLDPGFRRLAKKGLADKAVSPGKSKNMQQVMTALYSQAKDVLNKCNTTMLYKARTHIQTW